MILRLCALLIATAFPVSLAYPQSIHDAEIPYELSVVPECARECLRESLATTFSSDCKDSGTNDIQCYCAAYDSNGFTFGEAALRCFYMNCQSDKEEASRIYNVCVGQPKAVQRTMGSIPITRFPPSTTVSTAPPLITSSTSEVKGTMMLWPYMPTPITTSIPNETPGAASDATPGPSAAVAPAPHSTGPLSTPQIVGISVAGASALILATGAIILVTCTQQRRRRRAMEQAKFDRMENKSEKRSPPGSRDGEGNSSLKPLMLPFKVLRDPRSGPGGVGIAPAPPRSTTPSPRRSVVGLAPVRTNLPRLQLNDQRPRSQWINPDIPVEQIGLAISPESDLGTSPDSMRSTRTVSRLLPAKPSPQLARPTSTASGLTVFEEDRYSRSVRQSQAARPPLARLSAANALTELPTPPTQMSPFADPTMVPRPLNHSMRQVSHPPTPPPPFPVPPIPVSVPKAPSASEPSMPFTPAPIKSSLGGPKEPPVLSLNIPIRQSRTPLLPNFETFLSQASSPILPPKPLSAKPLPTRVFAAPEYTSPATEVPPRTPNMANLVGTPPTTSRKRGSNDSTSTDGSEGYVPKYYASPRSTAGAGKVDKPSKSPRIIDIGTAGSTKTSTPLSRSSTHKSASVRDSMASCTTFETADMDEPTPPSDEEKTLPAIPESPISGLKYPKIPRASNQAVPRSPRSSHGSLTLDTRPSLLQKRRGDDAAQDLEKRLFVSPISSSLRSSNTTHSRVGSDGTLPQQVTYSQLAVKSGPGSADMFGPLKSPMWAPRITPTRRGQDLFLSVS
ncbi:hypothetical protein EJ05DRAFT_471639 [Pseudovirgaria hyperparasitica]|uniref:Extracellular membrane protein CFEM domain-containing protein n=1 Tax=Pseudovirgaria hyperparasitica TaxID=470096 RepID=A0A6A6WKJ4_9PEZI|nr:uncharacterized protein EJ05DRAFT_471639 [Pseudovirgaria hyperparasitica]KAF2762671.1 hypothetical protein EJ05DRAFT_471639 [Pseudovirgaria hyperparasitica]